MGVFPACSLRVAVGDGTLRGAGEDSPKCAGVVTWPVGFLDAEPGWAGCEGVGVDMTLSMAKYPGVQHPLLYCRVGAQWSAMGGS